MSKHASGATKHGEILSPMQEIFGDHESLGPSLPAVTNGLEGLPKGSSSVAPRVVVYEGAEYKNQTPASPAKE